MKIYLSGPISDVPRELSKLNFDSAEKFLMNNYQDCSVVNPINLQHDDKECWEDCMAVDILELIKCDAIYLLVGWESSRGAMIEHAIAKKMGIKIAFQK